MRWSSEYFVYDYEKFRLVRSFSKLKDALDFCSKKTTVEYVIVFEQVKTARELDNAWVYSNQDDFIIPINPVTLLKKLSNREYVANFPVGLLQALVLQAKDAYYNSDSPIMSDAQFDYLEAQLKKRFPKSKALKVGAEVKDKVGPSKVTLPFYMGSMNKIKFVEEWPYEGPYVVSDKLDGVSLQYDYTGNTPQLYTRGNGIQGQNVSHLLPMIALPKLKQGESVRGEMIFSETAFKKYAKQFANPRNMMSGMLGRNDAPPALKDATFIAFELLSPRKKPSAALAYLSKRGFEVPFYKTLKTLDTATLSQLLAERKSKSKYAMDGLVIYDDNEHPVNTSGNPDWAFAFKTNEDAQEVTVVVTDVEWNVSRLGSLKPTVLFDTVALNGVNVSRATGHNARYIVDNGIGRGAKIKILRSGDVIPYITKVVKKAKPSLPNMEYEWDATETNFVALDKSTQAQKTSHLAYALKVLGVENVGSKLVSILVENGYDNLATLKKAKLNAISEMIGPNRAKSLLLDLKAAIVNARPEQLMIASGSFGFGFAERKFASLLESYPAFLTMTRAEILDLEAPSGFSPSSMKKLASGIDSFKKFVKSIGVSETQLAPAPKVKPKSQRLAGKVYVFSGVRDAELKATIESNGGKVVDTFTKDVTHLIVKDPNGTSSKIIKAKQNNIPVISIDQARKVLVSTMLIIEGTTK